MRRLDSITDSFGHELEQTPGDSKRWGAWGGVHGLITRHQKGEGTPEDATWQTMTTQTRCLLCPRGLE